MRNVKISMTNAIIIGYPFREYFSWLCSFKVWNAAINEWHTYTHTIIIRMKWLNRNFLVASQRIFHQICMLYQWWSIYQFYACEYKTKLFDAMRNEAHSPCSVSFSLSPSLRCWVKVAINLSSEKVKTNIQGIKWICEEIMCATIPNWRLASQ